MVPASPRLRSTGVRVRPTSLSRGKFCACARRSAARRSCGEERLNVARVHDLSHDGKACLGPRLAEEVESALAHALVGVGRGAGRVGAAAEQRGTRRLDAPGDADEVLALNRAGPGDHLKVAAADGNAAAVPTVSARVELAVGFLKGLRDALHALDDVHRFEQEGVDLGRIAHKADDRLVLARG